MWVCSRRRLIGLAVWKSEGFIPLKNAFPIPARGLMAGSNRFFSSQSASEKEQESFGSSDGDLRTRVLEAALKHVNKVGWSKDALALGSQEIGLSTAMHGLFSRGAAELAEYWMRKGNDELQTYLSNQLKNFEDESSSHEGDQSTLDKFVADAIFVRLQHTIPFLRSWPQAMAIGLHPENIPTTAKLLHEIPEIICQHADRKSGGVDWSDRLAAIGAIYASSELYMLTDHSEGFVDTRNFVSNRLRDSLLVQETVPLETVNAAIGGVGSLFRAASSMLSPLVFSKRCAHTSQDSKSTPFSNLHVNDLLKQAGQLRDSIGEIAKSPNPVDASLKSVKTFVESLNDASDQQNDKSVKNSSSDSHVVSADDFGQEAANGDYTLETVKLPSGLSLFGLLSRDAKEAQAIVEASNPNFSVVITSNSDSDVDQVHSSRFVRLMIDDDGIVVDILRS